MHPVNVLRYSACAGKTTPTVSSSPGVHRVFQHVLEHAGDSAASLLRSSNQVPLPSVLPGATFSWAERTRAAVVGQPAHTRGSWEPSASDVKTVDRRFVPGGWLNAVRRYPLVHPREK